MGTLEELTKYVDDLWDAKKDVKRFISRYHKDSLIGDENALRRKQLRFGEAIQLIQNMESEEHIHSISREELISAWVYWFACVEYMYWFDIDEIREDLNIKELVEKYSK